jgi:hypothetical protein
MMLGPRAAMTSDSYVLTQAIREAEPFVPLPCAHRECATRHAPSTGTGVVTFLMG